MIFTISEADLKIMLAHISRRRRDERRYKPTYALHIVIEGEQMTVGIVREKKQNRKDEDNDHV